jgi:hypothetical protein
MNLERAAMKGRLAELEGQINALRHRGRGLAGSIRLLLNDNLTALEDMEISQAAELMGQLQTAHAELLLARSEISRLERELR